MNEEFQKRVKEQQIVVRASRAIGANSDTLDGLANLASMIMEAGKTDEAAQILAFILNHPDVSAETYDKADDLFIDLESRICPRVIYDAKLSAVYQTMDSMITLASETLGS